MNKYKYNINNLDCASCAREIEEELNKNKRFKNVVVNFSTSKISYETDENISLKELNDLVKKVEPEASISSDEVKQDREYHLSILLLGIVIGLIGNFLAVSNIIKTILFIISYTLLLYRTTINTVKLLFKSKTINENALITISCIGALAIGESMEGMMVIVLYTIGKILEEKAINNSRKSIKDLLDIKQPYANKKENTKVTKIEVEQIKVNDILVVKKGEKIPVDGTIIKGNTLLDTSALTGESELVNVTKKDNVLSGSINVGDIIEIKATSLFENSTVSKILELLESATDKKTKTETTVAKISKIYTPTIIILAILVIIFLPMIANIPFKESLYRGLTFLVISCPCAIAISIPLSYFTGIGVASRKGILIKGSNYLDNLINAKNIIFDKTGTLTNGTFTVTDIKVFDDNYTKNEVIDILIKGESLSNHPIAKSIMNLKNKKIDNKDIKDFKEIEGKGISYTLNNDKIRIGNKHICDCNEDAMLHLNINDKHIASVSINDGIKENAVDTIKKIKSYGIKTYMFTGDKKEVALNIGKKLNIDEIKYEMLPTDKFNNFELISNNKGITIFVGDGINDAPVLKRADIGISMGGVGSESAIEASDIVLMKDDLIKIPQAIDISRYTKKIIKQNLIFAILIKLLILSLSVFGFANMWLAVFADTGVTLITILNTLRIIKKFKSTE
jgi:Cd2+/Zn2+-exporting ATPase